MKTMQRVFGSDTDGVRKRVLLWQAGLVVLAACFWQQPAWAAETGYGRESWQSGAGVAAWIDRLAEEADGEAEGPQEQTEQDETQKPQEQENEESVQSEPEDGDLVMAHVHNVLNVREEPGSDAALAGYLYADCGGTILERRDGWTKLESGELTGWASDEYLLFGEEAEEAAHNNGRTVAKTTTGALRIRKEPSMNAGVYDLLEEGAEYEVVNAEQLAFSDDMEITDEWVAVSYEGKTGFVSAEYVKVEHLIDFGETVEQVKARQEAEKAAAAQSKKASRQQEIEKLREIPTTDDLLLAALIQCEAGGDIYEGQVAVGAVVLNRVKSAAYPNTIRDVIFASGQFTPAGSGKLGRVLSRGNIQASCIQAAQEALAGVSPVGTATHFRRAGGREGIIVGAHVFW